MSVPVVEGRDIEGRKWERRLKLKLKLKERNGEEWEDGATN